MATLLLAIIYLAFISLGLPDSLLGAGWPVMRQAFQVPLSYAGCVSMIISGGTICSSLLSERLTKRFSTRLVTLVSVLMTAAALFGFSTASAFWMLCLWAVPYGLGAGAIDSALNNYIALHYSARHMSWLHSFWGVGTIVSPYVMSYALANASWQAGYRIVSFLQLGIAAVLLCTLPLWRAHGEARAEEASRPVIGLRGALKIKGVPSILTGFFAYCAAESTAMLWASSYLVAMRGLSAERAAAFSALIFIGCTAGRFVSGFVSDRLGDHKLIRIGSGIILVGILCMLLPVDSDAPTLAGLVIIGLGCAPIYPSIIHATPGAFGARNSQAIIGIQMASAYTGSTFLPPIFGALANRFGLWFLPYFIAAFFVLMAVMVERTFRVARGDAPQ